jgi:ribonuclease Z
MFLNIAARHRGNWRLTFALLLATAAPLATAHAQSLNVTLLAKSYTSGMGPNQKVVNRLGVNILVQAGKERLLFDCSDGLRERVLRLHIPPQELNACFLTRLVYDRWGGFLTLLFMGSERKDPLRVWGPAGTKKLLSQLINRKDTQLTLRIIKDTYPTSKGNLDTKIEDVSKGVVYQSGDLKVTAFTLDPGPANPKPIDLNSCNSPDPDSCGPINPSLAYRIDFAGHSIVLTGNTQYPDKLIQFSQHADVVIHEVMDSDRSSPDQAATLFTQVNPKLALFTSVQPEAASGLLALTQKTYSGPLEVGDDLMTIDIGEQVEFHYPVPNP